MPFGKVYPAADDLSRQAHAAIVKFLAKKRMLPDDHVFYTPEEWKARGEKYGADSLLIVTHDGGKHAGAFNWDYEQYKLIEELTEALLKIGVFVEQCTTWYSAVYKI